MAVSLDGIGKIVGSFDVFMPFRLPLLDGGWEFFQQAGFLFGAISDCRIRDALRTVDGEDGSVTSTF